MPTSSQALLLLNKESSQSEDKTVWTSKSSSQRSLKPCPVSSIDINEMLTFTKDEVKKLTGPDVMEDLEKKASSKKIQAELRLADYNAILSYSPDSDSFSLKVLTGKESESSCNDNIAPTETKSPPSKTEIKTRHTVNRRPKTADTSSVCDKKSVTFSKPLQYYTCINKGEKLTCVGLKMPVRKERVSSSSKYEKKPKSWSPRASSASCVTKHQKEKISDDEELHRVLTVDYLSSLLAKEREKPFSDDDEDNLKSENNKQEVKIERILPSTHVREQLPEKRPFDACFSLKDNERRSHRELKHLIQQQTGVHLTRMQYEPLSVMSGGRAPRSRWQVTTTNAKDTEALILNGLLVDDHKIVVLAADDVMRREYNTYWNIEDVQNEKRLAWGEKKRTNSFKRSKIFIK